ncbi:MAG: hypothetical protein KC505_06725, partial [Myxococcales bacterium]|nr:hypothetical protein [Myxococcales bacterium]
MAKKIILMLCAHSLWSGTLSYDPYTLRYQEGINNEPPALMHGNRKIIEVIPELGNILEEQLLLAKKKFKQ